jgi:hypothetical protein
MKIKSALHPPGAIEHKTREYKRFIMERLTEGIKTKSTSFSIIDSNSRLQVMQKVDLVRIISETVMAFVSAFVVCCRFIDSYYLLCSPFT